MKTTRRRDTACEVAVRQALRTHGLRYRVDHHLPIDGKRRADIVFVRWKLAVFIDGCFWHGCPRHRTHPKSNARWWREKIDANIARDRDTDRKLRAAGWRFLRVWEHVDPDVAAKLVVRAVRESTS